MFDRVLAIVRETMLHKNTVVGIAFLPSTGELLLTLLQPDEQYQYPDHELRLTFSGVASFVVEGMGGNHSAWQSILGIECRQSGGRYEASISVGSHEWENWLIRVVFVGLKYRRSTNDP